jgi:uncharacterized NAD(P)/FAD-binding protein YdhS
MSDSEKRQRKALVASACKTANSAARLEIFILEHLREYGADTRQVMEAIQEAKQGKFQNLQRLFECPSLSFSKELG